MDERRGLRLRFDADQVDALSADREALWARVAAADFLTVNEKRAAVGYDAVVDGDALGSLARKYSPDQPRVPKGDPDGGQWTVVAGDVIRICVEVSSSVMSDIYGGTTYSKAIGAETVT